MILASRADLRLFQSPVSPGLTQLFLELFTFGLLEFFVVGFIFVREAHDQAGDGQGGN